MVDKMIIDADLCIKLGRSSKYQFLYDVLPLISNQIYMHTHAYGKVMMPLSAVSQLKSLVSEGKVVLVNESNLDIIKKAKSNEIDVPRKVCKALWVISGKSKETFNNELWPVVTE